MSKSYDVLSENQTLTVLAALNFYKLKLIKVEAHIPEKMKEIDAIISYFENHNSSLNPLGHGHQNSIYGETLDEIVLRIENDPQFQEHLKLFTDHFADEALNHSVAAYFYLRGSQDGGYHGFCAAQDMMDNL